MTSSQAQRRIPSFSWKLASSPSAATIQARSHGSAPTRGRKVPGLPETVEWIESEAVLLHDVASVRQTDGEFELMRSYSSDTCRCRLGQAGHWMCWLCGPGVGSMAKGFKSQDRR
ncbi:hypothetical protein J3459_014040 [Metarhizium acridum]|uniref:uncharacterized protein n=1 Tax=Metarhizium acridum TaxID=92637 RepID=UPI001C6C3C62|nr:hypothetical protein J3458_021133 [Metarhizium acridum]KAG8415835.1 hypothetical protein J3459_014040 [Metarhizium acridum]